MASSSGALWVGAHLSKGKDLINTIHEMIEMGGNSLQIFLSPPINSGCGVSLKTSEIETAKKLKGQIFLIIHGKYILNFCRPRDATSEWQFKCLKHDMQQAHLIGSDVIIHQGKNVKALGMTNEEACQTFADNIMAILEETSELNNRIILENSCQQGNELGYTIQQLGQIFRMIKPIYRQRIGFCLDLCHIYVAGTCDLRKKEAVDKMFDDFHEEIGLDYLKVIHFNDSKIAFDGHNDNHADLMIGQIGNPLLGGSNQGFIAVVKMAQAYSIPMILETPRRNEQTSTEAQINLIRHWANGNKTHEEAYLNQNQIYMTQATAEALKKKKTSSSSNSSSSETLKLFKPPSVKMATLSTPEKIESTRPRDLVTDGSTQVEPSQLKIKLKISAPTPKNF